MNIEAMRLWAKHDQGHASTYLSLEDARLIVEVYDFLVGLHYEEVDYMTNAVLHDIVGRMEGV